MDNVLFCLCRHCVGIMDGWVPFSARCIADQCGVSISTARRRLRALKSNGCAKSYAVILSQDELCPPYRGWTITDKARETPEYKVAWAKERKLCREVFGEHIFPDEEILEAMMNGT